MIVRRIPLNLITLTLILLVDFRHLSAISVRVPVRLPIGFCPSFSLLSIKPLHGFVIFRIQLAEPILIAVAIIAGLPGIGEA